MLLLTRLTKKWIEKGFNLRVEAMFYATSKKAWMAVQKKSFNLRVEAMFYATHLTSTYFK